MIIPLIISNLSNLLPDWFSVYSVPFCKPQNQSGKNLEINQGRYHTVLSFIVETNYGKLVIMKDFSVSK